MHSIDSEALLQCRQVKSSANNRINSSISVGQRDIPCFAFLMISSASSLMSREKSTGRATHSYFRPRKDLNNEIKKNIKARHFAVAHNTGLYGVVHRFASSKHSALNATLE